MLANIAVPHDAFVDFCERHHIRKMSLFGSVLRDDFRPDSEIDVLVEFEEGHIPGLFRFVDLQFELADLFGREVDLNSPDDFSPYFRRKVLATAQVQYER